MFPYQKVHELNRLELIVYKYIIGHTKEVQNMTKDWLFLWSDSDRTRGNGE